MMIRRTTSAQAARFSGRFLTAAALVWLGIWTVPAFSEDIEEEIDGRYTYIRALDGDAELTNRDGDEETDAIANYPVLTGDRIETDDDTFIDIILSDGTQLTLGEDVELLFENLSGSPDGLSDDEGTLLQLLEGEALLRVGLVRTSAFYPVIDTANARIYIQEDGVYRIEANDHDFTEVSVLEGSVEVLTQTDDVVLASGEAASFDGYADPYVARLRADWTEEIVLWSDNVERRYSRGSSAVLDAPLSGTAHLDDSGDWVTVDTGRAWRPRVEATWRPYHRGRWTHTPSGLYWVSYDPWLPVTYRYGLWDLHPSHGWLWYPGYRYRTAHVYWYWGADYAGWIPSGYYNRYYRHRYSGFGFRAGVLGWAGLRWDPFYDWTFCPTRYIGYRNSYRHYERGRHLYDRGVRLERGIIATSTRGLGRDDWKRPALVSAALERGWRSDSRNRDLPDVTGLVSRGDLTPEVRDTFVVARERRNGAAASVNRSGRVATTIRDDASVPGSSSRGAVSTRSREAGRDGRVVRRSSTPTAGRSSSVPSGTAARSRDSSATPSNRGAVRRTEGPTASGTSRNRGTTSSRGAVPRSGTGSSTRSSSPARRVIDGAGSRGSSTRSSTPTRRPPTATSGSSGSSTRNRSATPTRRPPTARPSSGSSGSSRARTSTPPARRPSTAGSSSGRSSTRSSSPSSSTRRSTPPPRTRASSPPPRRSSSSSTTRRSTPPPQRSSSASSGASTRRPPAASASSSRGSNRPAARSATSRSSSSRSAAAGSRPSSRPSAASRSRATAQRSRSSAPAARSSASSSRSRSSASAPRRSNSSSRATASSSRSPSRSSAARSSSSRSSSSRSTAARSSSKRKPPNA